MTSSEQDIWSRFAAAAMNGTINSVLYDAEKGSYDTDFRAKIAAQYADDMMKEFMNRVSKSAYSLGFQ